MAVLNTIPTHLAQSQFVSIDGLESLQQTLKELPISVRNRVMKRGFRRAGLKLRDQLRADSPATRRNSNLWRAISARAGRSGKVWVGLRHRYYYKVFDYYTERGAPWGPWFRESWGRHRGGIVQLLANEIDLALTYEAGKAYARSKSRFRRR